MDRFVAKWKREERVRSGAPSLSLQQDEDGEEAPDDEDDMADFIVSDDEDDEEEEQEECSEEEQQEERKSPAVLPRKRVQLQLSTASSRPTGLKQHVSVHLSSAVAASASAPSRPAVLDLTRSSSLGSTTRRVTDPSQAPKRRKQEAQSARGVSTDTSATASAAAAAASSSDAIATAAPSCSQPVAATRTRALPPLQRASSTPSTVTAAAAASASSVSLSQGPSPSAVAVRKRKHLLFDDDEDEEEQKRLVDAIDISDDETGTTSLNRAATDATAMDENLPPSRPRNHNVLGLLQAVQAGTVPFASQQLMRLAKLRRERAAEAEASAQRARERGEESATAESIMSIGASSASAAAAAISATSTSASCLASDFLLPSYFSSPFRSHSVLHRELFHHSFKHLLWNRMRPVLDWSLCGPLDSMGVAPHASSAYHAPAIGMDASSYVNSIEFDSTGSLLSASSNNALLSIYDFDCIWMAGRRVETSKRARKIHAQQERIRIREALARCNWPPRSKHGWRLNQAPPPLRPAAAIPKQAHQLIEPIFSMDLQAQARARAANGDPSLNSQVSLKQIDTHRWNPFNGNELAMSSQRSTAIFLFDVSRCDESGWPHRRVAVRDANVGAASSMYSSCVMDFRYFSNRSVSHASSQTLVAALRSGEINVIDLRVAPGASSTDAMLQGAPVKIYKPQQRSDVLARGPFNAASSSNPPVSIQLSQCGNRLHAFTERGSVETWDTRAMRASMERTQLLEAMWSSSNPAPSGGVGSSAPTPLSSSLGLSDRSNPWNRVCSSSMHPHDDHAFLFQMLSGAVGMVDLDPCSPSFQRCHTVQPYNPDFVHATEEGMALRTKRTATFLHNGAVGSNSNASAGREKCMIVVNAAQQMQFIDPRAPSSHRSTIDSMLQHELQRSSDIHVTSASSAAAAAFSSLQLHVLSTVPAATAANSFGVAASDPIMALAAHPSVPYVIAGYKKQHLRLVTHAAELEQEVEAETDVEAERGETGAVAHARLDLTSGSLGNSL